MKNTTPHELEIVIDAQGHIHAEVKGIEGSSCEDVSKFLREMGEVVRDEKKPEYYRVSKQKVSAKK